MKRFMKMHRMFSIALFLFFSTFVYSQNFNVPDFPDEKIGTYMPVLLIDELEKTNNYLVAMSINNNRYYNVICINKNIVFDNLNFHDQYAIRPDEVEQFIFE